MTNMKRVHLTGRDISNLFGIIIFKEYLIRPGKNELMYSNEKVQDGQIFYLEPNYFNSLILSIKEAIDAGSMEENLGIQLLETLSKSSDYNGNDVELTPHLFSK